MDFNYLNELTLSTINQYFIKYIDEIRIMTIKEEKEAQERSNKIKSPIELKRKFDPNRLIVENNVLPTIRGLFISTLLKSYDSLSEVEKQIIKNKQMLMLSKFDKDDLEVDYVSEFNYSHLEKLEIEKLISREFRLTLLDIKNILKDLDSKHEIDPTEDFLFKYGFYSLAMVKCLTKESIASLIDELNNKSKTDIPGFLAFVYFLGLYDHLFNKFNSRSKAYKVLAQIVNRKDDTIKGHISSFVDNSYAKGKYNAYLKLPEAKDFYNNLKFGG
jgi:hypothetical protein